jgi:tetratricopeptide (TPR) repeat protein
MKTDLPEDSALAKDQDQSQNMSAKEASFSDQRLNDIKTALSEKSPEIRSQSPDPLKPTPHPEVEEDVWDKFSKRILEQRESQKNEERETPKRRGSKPNALKLPKVGINWFGETWKTRPLSLLAIVLSILALSAQFLKVQNNSADQSSGSASSPSQQSNSPEKLPKSEELDTAGVASDSLSPSKRWFEQGNTKLTGEDYRGAITDYNSAINLDSTNAEIYNSRGWAYYKLKEYSSAIEDYERSIKFDPDSATAYNNRGLAYYKLGTYEKAIADYTTAIGMKPSFIAATYTDRGKAYFALSEYQKAIADYSEAIRLNPNYDDAYRMKTEAEEALNPSVQSSVSEPQAPLPPLAPPLSEPEPVISSPASTGTWRGEWNADGYLFGFEMQIDINSDNNVSGLIHWTLKATPDSSDLKSKIGLQATEYIEGSYNPGSQTLDIKGVGKNDPKLIIALEEYKIHISKDGKAFDGETAYGGSWQGRISGRRVR